ncbi:MAG: metal-dependent transcriptional regulator [Ferruginibacter sp.]|nr:metal-dependent transcriptional regulator [Cytophagales bacterium]
MHSFTEENYLKAIYALTQKSEGSPDGSPVSLSGASSDPLPVNTNAIAERVATKAASVTDMLKKLADKQLIHYQKYQGVTLTETGRKAALNIIRRHRLWEVFLVDKLGFGWHEVHSLAEELEHIRSDELIDKLEAFLGNPQVDPHGDPIPDHAGQVRHPVSQTLSVTEAGQTVVVTGVLEHSSSFLQYLEKIGLVLNAEVLMRELNQFDKSLFIRINHQSDTFISHEVARNVLVSGKG